MATDTTLIEVAGLLSRREREVMDLAARGLTNARIAQELDVSTHVIKFHLASVYRKLDVANRTQAAALYVSALSRDGLGGGS